MGKRIIEVDASLLLEMCKSRQGAIRSFYTSKNPVPDDAKLVGYEGSSWVNSTLTLRIVLESDDWFGDDLTPLPPPEFRVGQMVWG